MMQPRRAGKMWSNDVLEPQMALPAAKVQKKPATAGNKAGLEEEALYQDLAEPAEGQKPKKKKKKLSDAEQNVSQRSGQKTATAGEEAVQEGAGVKAEKKKKRRQEGNEEEEEERKEKDGGSLDSSGERASAGACSHKLFLDGILSAGGLLANANLLFSQEIYTDLFSYLKRAENKQFRSAPCNKEQKHDFVAGGQTAAAAEAATDLDYLKSRMTASFDANEEDEGTEEIEDARSSKPIVHSFYLPLQINFSESISVKDIIFGVKSISFLGYCHYRLGRNSFKNSWLALQ